MKNRIKFVAAVACLFLVPFLLLSRHFLFGNKELGKAYSLRYLEMRTISASRVVAEGLVSRYSIEAFGGEKKLRAAGSAERKAILSRKAAEAPYIYSELALLGASGDERARITADKKSGIGYNYSKSESFAAARITGRPAGAVEYGEYTPPALILVEPVSAPGGKPEFYLAGRLSLAYLGDVVRLSGRNSYGSMGLVDAGGLVITDSARMAAARPGMSVPEEIGMVIEAAARAGLAALSREVKGSGRSYLISVSNVPGSGWWLYEVVDSERLPFHKSKSKAGKIVYSGVIMIMLMSVVTCLLALRWLAPREEEAA